MDPAARPSLSSTRRRMDPCKFYPWFSHYWKMNVCNPIKLQGHWCGQPGRGLPVPLHHAEPVAAVPAGGQSQVSNAAKTLFFFHQYFSRSLNIFQLHCSQLTNLCTAGPSSPSTRVSRRGGSWAGRGTGSCSSRTRRTSPWGAAAWAASRARETGHFYFYTDF